VGQSWSYCNESQPVWRGRSPANAAIGRTIDPNGIGERGVRPRSIAMTSHEKQSTRRVANAERRRHPEPKLVHRSLHRQRIGMDPAKTRQHGTDHEPQCRMQKLAIEHPGQSSRPQHRNQQRALAQSDHAVDCQFIPKIRRALEQIRSTFVQRQITHCSAQAASIGTRPSATATPCSFETSWKGCPTITKPNHTITMATTASGTQ
jgi:hypothetical protein